MADAMWERSIRFAFWNLNDREGFGHEKKKNIYVKRMHVFSRGFLRWNFSIDWIIRMRLGIYL